MKNLSAQELLQKTKTLVAEERRVTLALIEHLAEIQRRMLYAEMGYASLWEFATRELGLSEGAAQRRIQAMRLTLAAPEAKTALADGSLSLSNAAKLQSFRQAERKLGHKRDAGELLAAVQGLSQRECERKLFEISPEALPKERERMVSAEGERELKLILSPELHDKLQRLRGLLAHAKPDASYAELIEYAADEAIARLEKRKGIRSASAPEQAHDALPAPTAAAAAVPPPGQRGYLPVEVTRPVWARSQGQCEIQLNGRRCTSRHRLELDHITPLARGGANAPDNLRVACWTHNHAVRAEDPRLSSSISKPVPDLRARAELGQNPRLGPPPQQRHRSRLRDVQQLGKQA